MILNDNDVCKHCHKVIGAVPRYYCPSSPNQSHEPVTPLVSELPGGIVATRGTEEQHEILRKRAVFVAAYCQERGWNPETITVPQLMEIRSQPGWKQP